MEIGGSDIDNRYTSLSKTNLSLYGNVNKSLLFEAYSGNRRTDMAKNNEKVL